jgi:beta-galactosidase
LAKQQFVVQPYKFPKLKGKGLADGTNDDAAKKKGKAKAATAAPAIQKEETNSYVRFEAAGTTMTVGKWTGWIDYLDIDGEPMLLFRESITPEFWRAPTDNDYGAGLQNRFAAWKNPQMKLKDCKVGENSVVATFEMPSVKAFLTMTYTLTGQGEVIIREQLTADKDAKISPMFRYGLQLQMPKKYNTVDYYGRGPVENYIDRNSSEFIGHYINKVSDEYFPYIRPQESGNHTDVRWFRVVDGEGRGLEFYSDGPMEVSALHFLTEDLDDGPHKDKKWGRHSGDLQERPLTQVHLQQRQFGLGCVNSWGAWPRGEYQLPYKDYDFTVAVRKVK